MARNLLVQGVDWLHKQQALHASENIVISWTTDTEHSRPVTGSLVDEAGRVVPGQGAKTLTEFTRFLITAVQLINVPLVRGLRLRWSNQDFEVTVDGTRCWYFNDAHHRGIVLVTKNVSN